MEKHVMISAEDLSRLHQVELEILDEIHRICVKHNISYFLDSGTALGAVRHSGFIPWDDDVDVGMLREDYEKFIEIANDELSPRFFLQTHEKEKNYNKFHAKIRMKNTIFPEPMVVTLSNRGIFVDIFPFDYIDDKAPRAKAHISKSRFFMKAAWHTGPEFNVKRIKNKLIRLVLNPRKYHTYRLKFEKCIKKNSDSPTKHLTCFVYHMIQKKDILFDFSDIVPVKPIKFEDRTYMIMNNPDAYLTEMYGDYMILPPEEKRVCHVDGKIIFDISEDNDENR